MLRFRSASSAPRERVAHRGERQVVIDPFALLDLAERHDFDQGHLVPVGVGPFDEVGICPR